MRKLSDLEYEGQYQGPVPLAQFSGLRLVGHPTTLPLGTGSYSQGFMGRPILSNILSYI